MGLNALLMCRDRQALRPLAAALQELGVEQKVCESSAEAMELLVHAQYSSLVLDFDLPGAVQVGKLARMATPEQRRPVLFALVGPSTPIGDTAQAGSNVVLYKPLDLEQVKCSLRAGKEFMRADRRHAPRQRIETLVYLQFGVVAMPALVLDLSEQGLALQAPEALPPVRQVPLRFVLPGTNHMVEAMGEMIWSDDSGRAGLFFSQLKPTSRKCLKNWLIKRGARKRDAVRVLLRPERMRRSSGATH
ncbi:MAG TPA: PilZ domain-containing protein [Terriglobales bacterium]|nr:PilZ domain-containing protein [Terriglobales bacterium]